MQRASVGSGEDIIGQSATRGSARGKRKQALVQIMKKYFAKFISDK